MAVLSGAAENVGHQPVDVQSKPRKVSAANAIEQERPTQKLRIASRDDRCEQINDPGVGHGRCPAALDGGRALRAMLWFLHDDLLEGTRVATSIGRGLGAALLLLGVVVLITCGQSQCASLDVGARLGAVVPVHTHFDHALDVPAIVDAIGDLLDTVAWREVWGETDDRLGLVRAIETVEARVPAGSVAPIQQPTMCDTSGATRRRSRRTSRRRSPR